MKVLIIDDERKSRETLETLLGEYCTDVEVAGAAEDINQAFEMISRLKPDLVFLDISMPGGSGFELLKQIDKIDFEVVFVTAHDTYGIEALKAGALDYLLKPLGITELRGVIEKAKKVRGEKVTFNTFSGVLKQLELASNQEVKKMAVPSNDGLIFINPSDIVSLTADGSYTAISLTGKRKILSTRHLKEYEEQLSEVSFIRVHHSHIINLKYVKQYHRGEGGHVEMDDGSEIMISKRKKKEFLDRFIS